jgi:starch synthase
MRKAAVFLEAFIGLDPESPKAWSGTLPSLTSAMRKAGCLDRIIPLVLSRVENAWLLATHFRPQRERWRREFYFNRGYREAITVLARKTRYEGPVVMQLGALYSLPAAFPNKKCISIHDGNLAERVNSGMGAVMLSTRQIERNLRFEEELANQMTAVCTMSEYLRQSFIHNYHVPAERVFTVGGAINLSQIPEIAADKDYSNGKVLFIGAEFKRKGGPELLKAFRMVRKSVPGVELHIVGPVEIGEVPPGVVFHGYVSKTTEEGKATLDQLFRECSLFVMPSLYEPFGIAPIEAMMYQIPCVVTGEWALRELVQPGVNGALVERGSVPDLAAKLTELLQHPQRLAVMGRQARETAYPRYTWPAVVDRLAHVIDTI